MIACVLMRLAATVIRGLMTCGVKITAHVTRSFAACALAAITLGCAHAEMPPEKCIEVAVPQEIRRAAEVGSWEMVDNWKPPAVCVAIVERVNRLCHKTFKDGEHLFPADADFSYPNWKPLKLSSQLEVLRKIVNVDWYPYRDPGDAWNHLQTQIAEPDVNNHIKLDVATIDLWNTGMPETVYRFAWSEGASATPFDFLHFAAADLDAKDVGKKAPPPRTEYFLATPRTPFFFRDRTYVWEGLPVSYDVGSLIPPRGSDTGGEGCEFQTPGRMEYPLQGQPQ